MADKLEILIETWEEFKAETLRQIDLLEKGKLKKNVNTLSMPLEDFQNLMAGKKLEILNCLSKEEVHSVYHLAKLLKRDTKNVYDDVHALKKYGLIKDVRKGKKRSIKPAYSEIRFKLKI